MQHFKYQLTPKAYNQLVCAITKPGDCKFVNNFVLPYLSGGDASVTLSDIKNSERDEIYGKAVLAGEVPLTDFSFFTNPLVNIDPADRERHRDVNGRVTVNPFVTLTLEFDDGNLEFFEEQLSWARGQERRTKLDRFYQELRSTYHDVRGLTVCYSGNKSFHYHFTFATDHLTERSFPLDGYKRAWDRLEASFLSFFAIKGKSDPALRNAGHYRRLPTGTRVLDKPNLFGVPAGTRLSQCAIYDQVSMRAGKGASTGFLQDNDFATAIYTASKSNQVYNLRGITSNEDAFLEGKMRLYFPANDYPEFVGFSTNRNGVVARFLNSPGDRKPASYMEERYRTVMINGNNPMGLDHKTKMLPRPLGEMMETWRAEYAILSNPVNNLPPHPMMRARTQRESDFAVAAKDYQSATDALSMIIKAEAVSFDPARPTTLVSAPEGISKTRTLIQHTRYVMRPAKLAEPDHHPLVMFAFASYEAAEEKMAEFTAYEHEHVNTTFALVPMLVKSFSRLYAEWAAQAQRKPLDHRYAAHSGFRDLNEAIRAIHPEAIAYMRAYYDEQRARVVTHHRRQRAAYPVLFTVHDVAHKWQQSTQTRLMVSRHYGSEETWKARKDTHVSLLIHDEVSPEQLVYAYPATVIAWAQNLRDVHQWNATTTQSEKFDQFTAYVRSHPLPDGKTLTFEEAMTISDLVLEGAITITNNREYGEPSSTPDIYDVRAGNQWAYARAAWPVAQRTLLLTTEAVATAVARWRGDIAVIELDTPLIPRHPVETRRTVMSAATVAEVVKQFQDDHRVKTGTSLAVVSNKVAVLADTKTHTSAKGSNAYMGKSMIQTMMFMSPDQWESYEAWNALTGRTDLVRLRHIDEFNQTAGRNLGFRYRPGASHTLAISSRLFDLLTGTPTNSARYEMIEVTTKRQRTHRRAAA